MSDSGRFPTDQGGAHDAPLPHMRHALTKAVIAATDGKAGLSLAWTAIARELREGTPSAPAGDVRVTMDAPNNEGWLARVRDDVRRQSEHAAEQMWVPEDGAEPFRASNPEAVAAALRAEDARAVIGEALTEPTEALATLGEPPTEQLRVPGYVVKNKDGSYVAAGTQEQPSTCVNCREAIAYPAGGAGFALHVGNASRYCEPQAASGGQS